MNSLKVYNDHKIIKSFILLKKTRGGALASLVVIDRLNNSHLQAERLLTPSELSELLSKKDVLANQNIFIIEEDLSRLVVLLPSEMTAIEYGEIKAFIPSPYISKLFREAEFFSTQKTRGPNK